MNAVLASPVFLYVVHALVSAAVVAVYHVVFHGGQASPDGQAQGPGPSPAPASAAAAASPGGLAGQYPVGAAILEALAAGFEARVKEHAASAAEKVLPAGPAK